MVPPPTIRRPRRSSVATVARVAEYDTGVDGSLAGNPEAGANRAPDGDRLIVLGVDVRASHEHVEDGSF